MKNLDWLFMSIAEQFSLISHCVSKKVGCVAVRENRIIATGINGTASNMPNCDTVFNRYDFDKEQHHKFSERYEIHAEQNLICYCAKNGIPLNGCDIYITLFPCQHCLKLLSSLNINKIVYKNLYDRISDTEMQEILSYCNEMNLKITKL